MRLIVIIPNEFIYAIFIMILVSFTWPIVVTIKQYNECNHSDRTDVASAYSV